jgi:muramidase (phage lysozyme)
MTAAQTKRRLENFEYLQNPNVKAFLEMISKSEGTNGNYNILVFGKVLSSPLFPGLVGRLGTKKNPVLLPNLYRYPSVLVQVNSKLKSSAAGKYQLVKDTYVWVAARLGIVDFLPLSQDLIAVELLRHRGALNYILAGDIEGALKNSDLKFEWASIPGNDYKQFTHSIATLKEFYNQSFLPGAAAAIKNPVSSSLAAAAALFFFC